MYPRASLIMHVRDEGSFYCPALLETCIHIGVSLALGAAAAAT
jgi:hypothetical protein